MSSLKEAQDYQNFTVEVIDKLKTYVYRLIDPRNGETFYVGKGKGNRIFSHIRDEIKIEGDDIDKKQYKLSRIREIRLAGFEVAHVIHRHGMDDTTAKHVEAALIDAYPGLTNVAGGKGSNEYGIMHAKEIIDSYCAEPAEFKHKIMLICINRSATQDSLYDATRLAWKININRAKEAEYILATQNGIIVGAFVANEWLKATDENFPGRGDSPKRYGFNGHEAPPEIMDMYLRKRVPDEYRRKGAVYPIKYTWLKRVNI